MLTIFPLSQGLVMKRPSAKCKTPYVADILQENGDVILGHTASLGCCGLANAGATILMTPHLTEKKKQSVCTHKVLLAVFKERGTDIIIGIHPKLAEELVASAIQNNLLQRLQHVKSWKREMSMFVEGKVDSRFDFAGMDKDGIPFIMEVKNVPLADYEDISAKERKKLPVDIYDSRPIDSKVAYFPDGYRKKSADPVSPRALKHIQELTLIKKESKTRCIMCYVIQRTDVNRFQPSVIDPEYRAAFTHAVDAGVEIITLVVKWSRDGVAEFVRDDLPIAEIH
jgi:DNA-binding sugar fermentation-stimulating protein